MRNHKSIIVIILLIMTSIILSGCFSDRVFSYEEISNYVFKNEEELDSLISDNKGFDESVHFEFEKYLGSRTIVRSAYSYSSEVIEFYCGGEGLASDSKYSGFYYSKNDAFFGLEFNESRKTTADDGSVIYHDRDGISYVYTKRISPCWFYYYMEWH